MKPRPDQPAPADVGPPELASGPDGRLVVKVYLCRDCAARLRALGQPKPGLLNTALLCPTCRENTRRAQRLGAC